MPKRPIISARQVTIGYRTLRPAHLFAVPESQQQRLAIPSLTRYARRDCDILRSVIAYLHWRVESLRVPFTSWRQQPVELGCIVHAINLCHQAQSETRGDWFTHDITPTVKDEDRNPECERHPVLLAAELTQSAASVPKKPPQSQKLKSRRATA